MVKLTPVGLHKIFQFFGQDVAGAYQTIEEIEHTAYNWKEYKYLKVLDLKAKDRKETDTPDPTQLETLTLLDGEDFEEVS